MKKINIGGKIYLILTVVYVLLAVNYYVRNDSSMGSTWLCLAFSMFCIGISTGNEEKKTKKSKKKEAIFLDFYGTVVFEDGENIEKISKIIQETGEVNDISEVGSYWWDEFYDLFVNAYGETFRTQRDIEMQSLVKTIEHFKSSADAIKLSNEMFAYWQKPPIFEEAKQFFETSPVPIYIVSNIDTEDIREAIKFHGLKPAAVFTSEDAKSYKPRKELFEYALKATGLKPEQVVHIGDSLSSDVKGASALGIDTIWLNRRNREVPEGVCSVGNLLEVFETKFFK